MRGSSYPTTAELNSIDDLRAILAEFMPLQPEPAFTFVSYASAGPDTFVMTAKARDSARTVFLITPSVGPRKLEVPQ